MRSPPILLATILAPLLVVPVAAQQPAGVPQTAPQTAPPRDAEPDDIIVEGYRDRPDVQTVPRVPPAISTSRNRQKYAYSERLAKCAARSKLSSRARLRAVVDGEVNSATHHMAQDRLVRTYITCSESPVLNSFTTVPQNAAELGLAGFDVANGVTPTAGTGLAEAAPLGWSIYDRGAFTIQVLKQFAPGLRLTRAQTEDRDVQSRFNLREVPRNRLRFPADYRYFEVAVCMVRVQPELSVRLAMSDGSARFGDLQAALIDRARVCVGGAPKVQVDPTQFRLYIADAVYRWAVAARNVSSLIPAA